MDANSLSFQEWCDMVEPRVESVKFPGTRLQEPSGPPRGYSTRKMLNEHDPEDGKQHSNHLVREVTHIRAERVVGSKVEWEVTGDGMSGEYYWAESTSFNAPKHVLEEWVSVTQPAIVEAEKMKKKMEKMNQTSAPVKPKLTSPKEVSPKVVSPKSSSPKGSQLNKTTTASNQTYEQAIAKCPLAIDNPQIEQILLETSWNGHKTFICRDVQDRVVVVLKSWLIQKYGTMWAKYLFDEFKPKPIPEPNGQPNPSGLQAPSNTSSAVHK